MGSPGCEGEGGHFQAPTKPWEFGGGCDLIKKQTNANQR